jgi:hypothetical protein
MTQAWRYSDPGQAHLVGHTSYRYEPTGAVAEIQHLNNNGGNIADFVYAYDLAGRLVNESRNGLYTFYNYDNTNQLTNDNGATYSYDPNGNRINTGYSSAADNQLSSDGVWTYVYDAEGNRIEKDRIGTSEKWTYGYDHANHLKSVERKSNGTTVDLRVDYKYGISLPPTLGNCLGSSCRQIRARSLMARLSALGRCFAPVRRRRHAGS